LFFCENFIWRRVNHSSSQRRNHSFFSRASFKIFLQPSDNKLCFFVVPVLEQVDDNIFLFHNRVVTACPRYFLERVENLPKCQSCLWFGGTAFEK
jgi:hypothetical protein